MSIGVFRLGTDDGIRYRGPTDVSDPSAPTAISAGTCEFRIYDAAKVQEVQTDAAADQADVIVKDASVFADGDPVDAVLDDGTRHETTVSSTDEDTNTVTLADSIPSGKQINAGELMRRKLGSTISASHYGTAAPNDDSCGYIGTKDALLAGISDGMEVHVEVSMNAGSGVTRRRVFKVRCVWG